MDIVSKSNSGRSMYRVSENILGDYILSIVWALHKP